MPTSVLDELLKSAPVVLDGAWGTQLQMRGLPVGACPDEWNLSHPELVEEVARAYVAAGSQIILTNTFGSNPVTLQRHGLADQVVAINRAGVQISRRAAAGRAKVFASIGPSGVMLMMGEKTPDELRAAFAVQAEALAQAGADGLVIETMSDPAEALLALEAARATGLPVVVCMTFDSGKNRDRTMMGTTPEQAAEQLTAAGADVIGANCGAGPENYVEICRRLKAATDRPIWIKPNAGLPEVVNGQTVYRLSAEDFSKYVPQLLDAGASFIGGCCGTTPEFIRAICRVLGRA
ncbi:MAG TPA: homocysteine S-methyltransferase family protein [Thermogutta sp.]|nr:homocysteine S-methyltransferase family protein [Thermogutta sp.]HPU05168.1 homocysteine S-methyltransferase family protein [Thermogutta sp.]